MTILLWDIDGTLVRSGGAGKLAIESALCETFGLPELSTQVTYSGRTDTAIIRDLLTVHGIDPTPANVAKLVDAYLPRLPESLRAGGGDVLPGVRLIVERLASHNTIKMGLLTGNMRRGAELKLSHFGLWHYFPFGGFGDRHHDRDDVARDALAAAGETTGRDVWVIGDTPLDVKCARAIGAKALAVATGYHTYDELAKCSPDIVVDNLVNVVSILQLWERG